MTLHEIVLIHSASQLRFANRPKIRGMQIVHSRAFLRDNSKPLSAGMLQI